MLIKSSCIFDSIHDEPFGGYIQICGDTIHKVIIGEAPAELKCCEEIIDCGDRTVMAGFCDNHVHVFLGGLDIMTCNLSGAHSEETAASLLHDFYKDRDDKWVIGFGWSHYSWPGQKLPSKECLDRYFPDRPVVAVNDELHAIWVNSKALKLCGITKELSDPPHSMIARDENGKPTGYLLEQDAMQLVTDIAFHMDRETEKNIIKAFIRRAHSQGVTSVGDMEIINVMKADTFGEMEQENDLDLRIFFSPSIRMPLHKFIALKEKYSSDRLSLLGAKGFIDGTPLGHTGMLVEDYSDIPGFKGEPVLDLEWLKEKIALLNDNEIPARLHACGDGAVRTGLRYIAAAQENNSAGHVRNTIEHIECIHSDDLDLFKSTGTIASIQPYHMSTDVFEDHPIFDILGKERCRLAWPSKTLMKHGAHLTLGTDCPIVPLDPMQTLYCAINRVMEDKLPENGWNPQEKLTMAEALKCCTAETAYLFRKENRLGTLQEGALADLVILSDNIFKCAPMKVRDITVEKTIFNGKTVYEKGGKNE